MSETLKDNSAIEPAESEVRYGTGKERMKRIYEQMIDWNVLEDVDEDDREVIEFRINRLPDGLCDLLSDIADVKPEIYQDRQSKIKLAEGDGNLFRFWGTMDYVDTLDIAQNKATNEWSIGFVPDTTPPPSSLPFDIDAWTTYRQECPAAAQTRLIQAALLRPDICNIVELGNRVCIVGRGKKDTQETELI